MSNDYWQTPEYILEKVRLVLDDDYFDPCPINPQFDGLQVEWKIRCFINPPYSRGSLEKWSVKADIEYRKLWQFTDPEFIWLINYGCTANRQLISRKATAICIPDKRVAFINPETGVQQRGNDRDQMIYYWGTNPRTFREAFEVIGEIFIR